MLTLVALGLFLGMTLWFSATAAAPAIAAEFSIMGAGLAWLTMAVQGGFVAGTLVSALLNLADVVNARHLFAWGCLAGAIANAAIPFAPSGAVVVLLRTATGVALAFVYPPGLKIAAGWFLNRRGTALGVVVGALTLGSAFPHLMAWAAADLPWRSMLWVSSALAIAGGAIVALGVRDGPYVSASAPFDPRAVGQVVSNRGVRLATLGYLGHMWELYAMWAWMPAFAAASIRCGAAASEERAAQPARSLRLSQSPAVRWAASWPVAPPTPGEGENCRRGDGRQRLLRARAGFAFGRPLPVLLIFAVCWGFSIVADSAQFSALVAEYSPRTHVGTALTLQICLGFLLTMISMRLLPVVASATGWHWAFLLLVPGPVLGGCGNASGSTSADRVMREHVAAKPRFPS